MGEQPCLFFYSSLFCSCLYSSSRIRLNKGGGGLLRLIDIHQKLHVTYKLGQALLSLQRQTHRDKNEIQNERSVSSAESDQKFLLLRDEAYIMNPAIILRYGHAGRWMRRYEQTIAKGDAGEVVSIPGSASLARLTSPSINSITK